VNIADRHHFLQCSISSPDLLRVLKVPRLVADSVCLPDQNLDLLAWPNAQHILIQPRQLQGSTQQQVYYMI